ncbi:hypothetical protein [Streptomyces sp. YIM S03343]
MEQVVVESVRYAVACAECGARAECCGVQALVDGRLRWDVESVCSGCGAALAVCGGEVPDAQRELMLAVNGPAALRLSGSVASRVAVLRVLRAELGVGLGEAQALAGHVLDGTHSGTLPEMELLARALRRAGVGAVAVRERG